MKKILLTVFFLSSFVTIAQDWAPYKLQTDRHQHYKSLNTNQAQTQSIVVDTSYSTSRQLITHVFKRGFSKFGFRSNYTQFIKAQIFGDTARVYIDSSVFKSIDTMGYCLYFPHKYRIGNSFTLAKSLTNTLNATVDSLYLDSLSNGSTDSLVKMTLTANDLSGGVDTSNQFHHSEIIVSKGNGMIKGVDFTNLSTKVEVEQSFFGAKKAITNRENYSLSVNDEYHFVIDSVFFGSTIYVEHHIVKVIGDTLIKTNRTLTFEHSSRLMRPFPSLTVIDTVSKTFVDTAIAFVLESMIIEDSVLTNPSASLSGLSVLTISYCGQCPIINFALEENQYDLQYSFFTMRNDSILAPSFLTFTSFFHQIGVDRAYSRVNGGLSLRVTKSIVYVRKGNRTSGTPISLTTSLSAVELSKDAIQLYPNPAQQILQIDSGTKLLSGSIYNNKGQLLKQFFLNTQIDVSDLSPGIYFIAIETKEGITNRKFIKN